MLEFLEKYEAFYPGEDEIRTEVNRIKAMAGELKTEETLKTIFGLIDLTTLNTTDNHPLVKEMCRKVNEFPKAFPALPNVAAICVYPPFVNTLKEVRTAKFNIASVGGCFPSSQSYIDIKLSETAMIAEEGADEIDIVISVGSFLDGDYSTVFNEIQLIRETVDDVHLKTILETGALENYELIWDASVISMEAGSDFIKTSTGKMPVAATPEAAFIMCKAIKAYYEQTGKKIGFKPAGGISISDEALVYYAIVKEVLGEEWINPELFRIGASRLANNLLTDITGTETKYF